MSSTVRDSRFCNLLIVIVAALFMAAPGALPDKLTALAAGVCPQRPAHSYILGGLALPLEARMLGIFAGFLIAAAHVAVNRGRGLTAPSPRRFAALLIPVVLMGADGLNAVGYDLGLDVPYAPLNALRLATGLLGGAAVAFIVLPVAAASIRPASYPQTRMRDLLVLFVAQALVWLAPVAGWDWAYYPLAFLGIGGLVLAIGLLNLMLLTALRRTSSPLADYASASLILAIAELMGLAALRQSLFGGLTAPS